jgi:hypothetical protein
MKRMENSKEKYEKIEGEERARVDLCLTLVEIGVLPHCW